MCVSVCYLVHLVCGAVLADSDRDGGLVWQGYPQFYVRHSVVVLERETVQEQNQPGSHLVQERVRAAFPTQPIWNLVFGRVQLD